MRLRTTTPLRRIDRLAGFREQTAMKLGFALLALLAGTSAWNILSKEAAPKVKRHT